MIVNWLWPMSFWSFFTAMLENAAFGCVYNARTREKDRKNERMNGDFIRKWPPITNGQ